MFCIFVAAIGILKVKDVVPTVEQSVHWEDLPSLRRLKTGATPRCILVVLQAQIPPFQSNLELSKPRGRLGGPAAADKVGSDFGSQPGSDDQDTEGQDYASVSPTVLGDVSMWKWLQIRNSTVNLRANANIDDNRYAGGVAVSEH